MHNKYITPARVICAGAALVIAALLACSSKKVAQDKPVDTPTPVAADTVSGEDLSAPAPEQFPTVHFAFDSATLTKAGKTMIHQQAQELKNTGSDIKVVGACDERGTVAYNYKLGMRRARSVRAELLRAGISSDRIQISSLGKTQPLALGHDEDAWAQNRRAEMQMNPTVKNGLALR